MAEDWLDVPGVDGVRRAHEALAPAGADDQGEHEQGGAVDQAAVNLAAPEHRDKLRALFQWVAEGRSWDEVRDEAVAMVFPPRRPPEPR
jgi:hypothetical protein